MCFFFQYLTFPDTGQGQKMLQELRKFCNESKLNLIPIQESSFYLWSHWGVTTQEDRAKDVADFSRLVLSKVSCICFI